MRSTATCSRCFACYAPVRSVALALLLLFTAARSLAQQEVDAARQHLMATASKQRLTPADIEQSVVSSAYLSPTTGWYHVYFNQTVEGVEVHNRVLNAVIMGGQVRYVTHSYTPEALTMPQVGSLKSAISPLAAIERAAASKGFAAGNLTALEPSKTTRLPNGVLTRATYAVPTLSNEDVETRLYWSPQEIADRPDKLIQKLVLVWQVRFLTFDKQHSWNIHVNAASGAVVQTVDEVIHCDFGGPNHPAAPHVCQPNRDPATPSFFGQAKPAKTAFAPNSYNVFDYPLESPSHGSRSIVTNPYTRFAPAGTGPGATNGWHTDGTNSYTDTRGNNVWTQEDTDANNSGGFRPSSATLDFDHPYTLGLNTAAGNQSAAITNLFYWNNLIHDVLWRMGFDEPSGNFQTNNLGRGGAGNDHVQADAQDGSGTNNANFNTPPDGGSGRMQMFLWNIPSTYQADSDFDNAIIAHEYGHGWSIRLTGGPTNVNCLWNAEQGGEGWSDYLGLMLTTNWASLSPTVASANIPRGIGTYVLGQGTTTGAGIRPYRYSYDMTNVNGPVTYAKVGDFNFSQPHGIGSIWCTMLWDMTWEIILQDGQINPNVFDAPTSVTAMRGNVAALKLVNEGLRLQPCSPSFVDARNAILQADQMLFGGRYRCAIGRAFARRGLGAGASTGESSSDRIVVENFTPITEQVLSTPSYLTVCTGQPFAYTVNVLGGGNGLTFNWTRPALAGITNPAGSGNTNQIAETLVNNTTIPRKVEYLFQVTPDACAITPVLQTVNVVVYPTLTPVAPSFSVCQNSTIAAGMGLQVVPQKLSTLVGSIQASSGTYVRGSGNNTTTYSAGESVFFTSYSFVAPVGGPMTFDVLSASLTANDNDTYLSLYQTSFDPANPATNFLRGDDDSGPGYLSSLTHPVVGGTTYQLVVATYNPNVTGVVTVGTSEPVFDETVGNVLDGLITASSGTYLRPLNSGPVYSTGNVATTFYSTHTFVAPISGSVLFETPSANFAIGGADPYVSLYQTSFDPANPATNFLYGDDDSGPGFLSSFSYSVTAGTRYVLVVGTYFTGDTGPYTLKTSVPVFAPGSDVGWFTSPTAGTLVGTGYTFNPVGVAGAGVPTTGASLSATYHVSRLSVPVCRQPMIFRVLNCAPSFDSATSGNWNVPGTWTCNCIPDGTKPVRIMSEHLITVPNAYTGQAQRIQIMGAGKVNVQGSGRVLMPN